MALMSALDSIKQFTTIVADTGDFEGNLVIRRFFLNFFKQLRNLSLKMPLQILVYC